jgi:hypothetical protein
MKSSTVSIPIRASILFVLGGEVSLYKERVGFDDDAGLGSAQNDERLAEIDDEVAQFG